MKVMCDDGNFMVLTLGKDISSPSLAIWLSEDHGNLRITLQKLNYSFYIICGYEALI